jgi:hypothetical protein
VDHLRGLFVRLTQFLTEKFAVPVDAHFDGGRLTLVLG